MKLVLVMNQDVADVLQAIMAPGVEVVAFGDRIDSTGIDTIFVLGSVANFQQEWLQTIAESLEGRIVRGASMSVILI